MILEIERELWSALIDVAKGTEETLPRLHGALSRIEEIIQQESFTEISEWFGGAFVRLVSISRLTSRQTVKSLQGARLLRLHTHPAPST
jgi:hypothetical protein